MPRSIRRAPWPMPPGCSSRIRPIRWRTPPMASRSPRRWNCSSAPPAATASRSGASIQPRSAASACRCTSTRCGSGRSAGCCISSARFTHVPRRPQPKLLIVAPMSGHYATLLRGTVEAFLPNHDVYITDWRNARSGAGGGRPLRSRRLHRLRHLHPAHARRRRACDRGVPAVGAGARRRRADGGRQGPLRAAFHGADGRADRHPHQRQRRSTSWPRSAASTGSAATSSARCRSRIPASCATSIPAFCNCTASSA